MMPSGHSGYAAFGWIVFCAVQLLLFFVVGLPFWRGNVLGSTRFLYCDEKDVSHIHSYCPVFDRHAKNRTCVRFQIGGWLRHSEILPADSGYGRERWRLKTWDGELFSVTDSRGQSFTGIQWEELLWFIAESNGATMLLNDFFLLARFPIGEDLGKSGQEKPSRIKGLKELEGEIDALGTQLQKIRLLIFWARSGGLDPLPREIRERIERFIGRFFLPRQAEWNKRAKRELEEEKKDKDASKKPPYMN